MKHYKLSAILLLLFLSVIIGSCINDKANTLIGKTIIFPSRMNLFMYDYNQNFLGTNSKCKLLVSYDSLMCGNCAVKRLTMWNDILLFAEDNNSYMSVLIVFSPKQTEKNQMQYQLSSNPINYPIFFDSDNVFMKTNELPNGLFVCLLDSANNIIMTGSPFVKEKWQQYRNSIYKYIK